MPLTSVGSLSRRLVSSSQPSSSSSLSATVPLSIVSSVPFCYSVRTLSYKVFDTSKSFAQQRKGVKKENSPSSSSSAAAIRRREGGLGVRPTQSSVQAKKEAEMDFPQTLKSGRPAQLNTKSQRLFFENRANVEEFAKQQQIDREYVRKMREAQQSKKMDRRFFSRVEDYRDIAEPDPYADLFGETASTHRLRTAAWQRQFEKENEDVELPYERTNVVAKLAPNWFVRYFVNLRDRGGADHLYAIIFCFVFAVSLLWVVGYMFYTAPSRARPVSEIR